MWPGRRLKHVIRRYEAAGARPQRIEEDPDRTDLDVRDPDTTGLDRSGSRLEGFVDCCCQGSETVAGCEATRSRRQSSGMGHQVRSPY